MRLPVALTIFAVALVFLISGCTKPQGYGKPIDLEEAIKIGDVLAYPEALENKKVLLSGKIVSECPTGCWFVLGEGEATIEEAVKALLGQMSKDDVL